LPWSNKGIENMGAIEQQGKKSESQWSVQIVPGRGSDEVD
jgi:hypothetical protein